MVEFPVFPNCPIGQKRGGEKNKIFGNELPFFQFRVTSLFCSIFTLKSHSIFALKTTVTHMASGGLRAAYLSASTEADAGYKASNTHFPRHWLYAMLAVVFYSILFNISLSFSPTFSLSNSFSDIFNEF